MRDGAGRRVPLAERPVPTVTTPMAGCPRMRRLRRLPLGQAAIWAAVALAFADSSIVVLALPDLLRQLDTSIGGVSLVITIYNVAVVVATPLVIWLVRRPARGVPARRACILFAAGSAGCALAGSLELLVALRVVQALGGAFLLASALPDPRRAALERRRGGRRRARPRGRRPPDRGARLARDLRLPGSRRARRAARRLARGPRGATAGARAGAATCAPTPRSRCSRARSSARSSSW